LCWRLGGTFRKHPQPVASGQKRFRPSKMLYATVLSLERSLPVHARRPSVCPRQFKVLCNLLVLKSTEASIPIFAKILIVLGCNPRSGDSLCSRIISIAIGDRDLINVRFGPLCGLTLDISRGPRSANCGH